MMAAKVEKGMGAPADLPVHNGLHSSIGTSIDNDLRRLEELTQELQTDLTCVKKLLHLWSPQVISKDQEPQDIFRNGQVVGVPYVVFEFLLEAIDDRLKTIVRVGNEMCGKLGDLAAHWNRKRLYEWLHCHQGVGGDNVPVDKICSKVCCFLSRLLLCVTKEEFKQMNSIPGYSKRVDWRSLVETVLSKLLVIRVHLPPTIDMEAASSSKSKTETGGQAKKKAAPTKAAPKDEPTLGNKKDTTVGILGGHGFGEGLAITDVQIGLGLNTTLAQLSAQGGWKLHNLTEIYPTQEYNEPEASYNRTLANVKLTHFSRKRTENVWKQLYHAVYFVTVVITTPTMQVPAFHLQVLSFPLMVRTAANQALELIGAHLWYCLFTENVYDLNAKMISELPIRKVIDMLNKRFRGISNKRPFREDEEEFLQEKLEKVVEEKYGQRANRQMITLEAFIKQPMTFAHECNPEKKFSFWQWIQAVLNLLENILNQPWVDGVIYGFVSHKRCRKILEKAEHGTFMLKFSESVLTNNHLQARAFLNTVVKTEDEVLFVDSDSASLIEKTGLTHHMKNSNCRYLYGTDRKVTVETLTEKYSPSTALTSGYVRWNDPRLQKSNGEPLRHKRPKGSNGDSGMTPASLPSGSVPQCSGSTASSPCPWPSTAQAPSPPSSTLPSCPPASSAPLARWRLASLSACPTEGPALARGVAAQAGGRREGVEPSLGKGVLQGLPASAGPVSGSPPVVGSAFPVRGSPPVVGSAFPVSGSPPVVGSAFPVRGSPPVVGSAFPVNSSPAGFTVSVNFSPVGSPAPVNGSPAGFTVPVHFSPAWSMAPDWSSLVGSAAPVAGSPVCSSGPLGDCCILVTVKNGRASGVAVPSALPALGALISQLQGDPAAGCASPNNNNNSNNSSSSSSPASGPSDVAASCAHAAASSTSASHGGGHCRTQQQQPQPLCPSSASALAVAPQASSPSSSCGHPAPPPRPLSNGLGGPEPGQIHGDAASPQSPMQEDQLDLIFPDQSLLPLMIEGLDIDQDCQRPNGEASGLRSQGQDPMLSESADLLSDFLNISGNFSSPDWTDFCRSLDTS